MKQLEVNEHQEPDTLRERPHEYRARKISHYVVYFTITSSSLYYSVLLVSLWPYLNNLDSYADKHFLGYLAATGALGTTIFCPIFGRWSNSLKSCRIPFLITLISGFINFLIYVTLPLMPTHDRRYWFLFARVMTGMNDVNIGLSRGYIAESTTKSERRRAISIITGCQTIAFACGPSLQALMVPLTETGYTILGGWVKIDMYTSIGWLGLLTTVINMVLFHSSIFQHCDMRHSGKSTNTQSDINRYYKLVAWLFIMVQFWLVCNYLYLKVLGTPIVMDEFAMGRSDALQYNSYIVAIGAMVSLAAILTLDISCKKFGEMNVMYLGFLIMIVGRFVMYPIGVEKVVIAGNQTELGCPQWSQNWCSEETQMFKSQFVLSNVLDNFGYSWTITIIYTKFSQVLGAKQQGTWMGLMTALSGMARIVSPIIVSYLYVTMGNGVTVIVSNLVYIVLIVGTFWAIKHWTLKGLPSNLNQKEEETNFQLGDHNDAG